jgi:CheY-like chemotaxis protein
MSTARRTVLVVDEYAPFREAMDYCLPVFDLEPVVVADHAAALQLAAAVRVDVVLLDIGWPGLTGLQFCREITRGTVLQGIPVVLLSPVIRPEIVDQARAAGAAKLVGKLFLWADLLEALAGAMTPRRSEPAPGFTGCMEPRFSANVKPPP